MCSLMYCTCYINFISSLLNWISTKVRFKERLAKRLKLVLMSSTQLLHLDPYPLFVLGENLSLGGSGVMQVHIRLGEGAFVLS